MNEQQMLTVARVIRDDFYGAQDALDALPLWGVPVPGLARSDDYRLLASVIPTDGDLVWRNIAGARRRWLKFALAAEVDTDVDLDEALNLHAVLDIVRHDLCDLAGLDYRQHCDH